MNKKMQRRLALVRAAMINFESRPVNERIDLLLGAGEILTGADAEEAKLAAFTLQQSETNQLNFINRLKS